MPVCLTNYLRIDKEILRYYKVTGSEIDKDFSRLLITFGVRLVTSAYG